MSCYGLRSAQTLLVNLTRQYDFKPSFDNSASEYNVSITLLATAFNNRNSKFITTRHLGGFTPIKRNPFHLNPPRQRVTRLRQQKAKMESKGVTSLEFRLSFPTGFPSRMRTFRGVTPPPLPILGYPGAALFCYPGAAREGENVTPVTPYSVTPGPPGIFKSKRS